MYEVSIVVVSEGDAAICRRFLNGFKRYVRLPQSVTIVYKSDLAPEPLRELPFEVHQVVVAPEATYAECLSAALPTLPTDIVLLLDERLLITPDLVNDVRHFVYRTRGVVCARVYDLPPEIQSMIPDFDYLDSVVKARPMLPRIQERELQLQRDTAFFSAQCCGMPTAVLRRVLPSLGRDQQLAFGHFEQLPEHERPLLYLSGAKTYLYPEVAPVVRVALSAALVA